MLGLLTIHLPKADVPRTSRGTSRDELSTAPSILPRLFGQATGVFLHVALA